MKAQIIAQRANAQIPAITNASTELTAFAELPESGTPLVLVGFEDSVVDPEVVVFFSDFFVVVGSCVLDDS